jgi:hypothetical protein
MRIGRKWLTSRAALQRFAEATTPQFDGVSVTAPRSATARHRASERAAKRLSQVGI